MFISKYLFKIKRYKIFGAFGHDNSIKFYEGNAFDKLRTQRKRKHISKLLNKFTIEKST